MGHSTTVVFLFPATIYRLGAMAARLTPLRDTHTLVSHLCIHHRQHSCRAVLSSEEQPAILWRRRARPRSWPDQMEEELQSPSSPRQAPPGPCQWAACGLAARVLCALATCVFAAVGSLVGAVTGSLIGLATESGMLRGAGIGAISGAVFSIEVAESSRDLWHSGDSTAWTILYMVDIISSLLSGRLVREKVGPAVQSAVQSQISAISSPFAETTADLFETGGARGLAAEALQRLPEMEIGEESAVDAAACCAVCLQEFRVGEAARRLPGCRHVFHVACIDCWLVRHGSCPLCRRDV